MEIQKDTTDIIKRLDELETLFKNHRHNGVDNRQIMGSDIISATFLTSNYRSGGFEINSTGAITVATVPFPPTYIKITAYAQETHQAESFGTKASGSNSSILYKYYDGSKLVSESDEATSDLVAIFPDGGGAATLVSWTSFNSNGFTLNCTACPVPIDILWEVWS